MNTSKYAYEVPALTIVVPCYNEEKILDSSAWVLHSFLSDKVNEGIVSTESRILFVDDGSVDNTWEIIEQLCQREPVFSGIRLAHNRGHQNALLAGLMEIRDTCDLSISIDADLQDDVQVMEDMIRKAVDGADIVFGVRNDRSSDTFLKKTTAGLYYKMLTVMGIHAIPQHADFRLMNKKALEALSQYREVNLFLRGIVTDIGLNTDVVYYARKPRTAGESKYSIKKMMNLAEDGVTSFSTSPLRMSFGLGLSTETAGLVLLYRAMRYRSSENCISALIILLQGLQFVGMGILGEYVGKTYMEIKDRPRYFIEKRTDS